MVGKDMKKFLVLFLLAGCGFRPMYSGNDNNIYVSPIDGINGIELRNGLNARFGGQRSPDAKYKLDIVLQEPVTQYKALARTGDATWQEISLHADYTIYDGDKKIASGSESASESYSFVRYLVASNASFNNAVKNTLSVLAEKISARTIAETQKFEK